MLIPLISLLLLAVAVYFLIRTRPDFLLYDLMREVCGKTNNRHAEDDKRTGEEEAYNDTQIPSK
jgi:hypothetical protein